MSVKVEVTREYRVFGEPKDVSGNQLKSLESRESVEVIRSYWRVKNYEQ